MSGRPLEPAVDEAPGAGAAPLPFGGEVGPRVRRIALVAILLVHALLVWLERPAAIGAAA